MQDISNSSNATGSNGEQWESGWWDIGRAARYLSVSVPFLRKAVRFKTIPFARAGAKALRFRRSDLDRWLESSGSGKEIAYRKHEGR